MKDRVRRAAAAVLGLLISCQVLAQPSGDRDLPKPKLISTAVSFVRADGMHVQFQPSSVGSLSTTAVTATGATANDVMPCLFQSGWTACSLGDGKLATTDWGIGHEFNLDGVSQSYRSYWMNNTTGNALIKGVYQSTSCPSGWYFDAGGILGGDEVCWSPGRLTQAWLGPNTAGDYSYEGSVDGVVLKTGEAEVILGTIVVKSGSGQSTLTGTYARNPLVVAIRDFRGSTPSFPIDPAAPGRTHPFIFTISGPRKAAGASLDPSSVKPGGDGSASVRMFAGDKAGTYSISVTSDHTSPLTSGAVLNAVLRLDPDDHPEAEEENGEESCDALVGDPISVTIGNSFQHEVDYARTGLSLLSFERSYNSLGSKSGLMRNYWTTTYDRKLRLSSGVPVGIRRPDGRMIRLKFVNGEYRPERPYAFGVLKASSTGWTFLTEGNNTEAYDSNGRWTSFTDGAGRALSATYANKSGLLTKVTANTGETLTFAYNSFGQVATATDHAQRVWTYTYDGYSNLTSVKYPDGVYRHYYYTSGTVFTALTGIAVGTNESAAWNTPYVHWEYDSYGRATSNYFAGGLKRFDLWFNDITGERSVTDALSNRSIFTTSRQHGRGFVDGIVGPGFASCGFADSVVERDLNANVISRTTFGRTTQFGDYDERGQNGVEIEAAGLPTQRQTDYVYDPRFIGKPTSISQPSVLPGQRKTTQLTYDAAGNLLQESVTGFRPDGSTVSRATQYEYLGPYGQLSRVDGPRIDVQDITEFQYDATTKRLRRVIDASGVAVRDNITYTATGQIATEDRPNGARATFVYYPGSDLLMSATESGGGISRYMKWTYDPQRRVSSIVVGDGVTVDQVTSFTYNAASDITSISTPGGASIVYTYDLAGNREGDSYQRNGTEHRWVRRTFDAYGRVQDLVNPGSTWTSTVHPEGTLTSQTDGRNNVTSYSYDDFKRLTQTVQPGQIVTNLEYDAADRLSSVLDANSGLTRHLYDDLGNRVRLESPDSGVALHQYDAAGNLIQSVDALMRSTSFGYDASNRLKFVDRVDDADDEIFAYDTCLNGIGKLCSRTNGIGEYVRYEYDPLGRVAKQTANAGAVSFRHNAAGNPTEITYPSQRKVQYAYDASGQVTSVVVVDGGNSYPIARGITRLPFGPATSWIYGNGLVEVRQYDLQYRPVSINTTGISSVTYDLYDGNDNVARRAANGDVQNFSYDVLNRLDGATGAFGVHDYDHDAVGNRTRLLSNGESTLYAYQPASNQLLGDSRWTYDLDANGNQIRREASDGSGLALNYTNANRLRTVTDLQNTAATLGAYRYNGSGQRTAKSTPHGDTLFVYGLRGELLTEALPGMTVTQEYVYLDGQPVALLGPPAAPAQPVAVDQIVDNPTGGFDCSLVKNRVAVNGSFLRCEGQHFSTIHNWPWQPPMAGTYQVSVSWPWDDLQPRCFHYADGTACFGGYGNPAPPPAGGWAVLPPMRLAAGVYGLWVKQNHRMTSNVYRAEMDAARFVLKFPDYADRDYKYIHVDALGTPVRVTNKTGVAVWAASYDPFGTAVVAEDFDGDGVHQTLNFRFPGQYFDSETGLHYNYFRDYDPQSGRYLTPDPIGLAGGVNLYAYVRGNPISYADPFGLLTLTAYINRGAGNGNEYRFVLGFRPLSLKDVPGLGGQARRAGNWMERAADAMKPDSIGPKRPLKDWKNCATLDSKLQEEFENAGYVDGQQLTRSQAEGLLNSMYLSHPEMRKLYDLPSTMLDNAVGAGRSNWFNSLNEQAWGPGG